MKIPPHQMATKSVSSLRQSQNITALTCEDFGLNDVQEDGALLHLIELSFAHHIFSRWSFRNV